MTGSGDLRPGDPRPGDAVVEALHAFVEGPGVLVAGAPAGVLAGRTLVVKDVVDVAGSVTGAGNPDLAASRAPAVVTAPAVRALVDAGATVIGRTVTDELAYSLGGDNVHVAPPVNVAAPGRTTGGSSSGSAAAVAAGVADLGMGTDTGGSIRVPASYCGLFGWRPTHGSVSDVGVTPLAPSFDTVGLLTRDAASLRDAAAVLLGDRGHGDVGAAGPPRLVLSAEHLDVVDGDVADAVVTRAEAIADFVAGSAVPVRVELGVDMDEALLTFRHLQGAEAWAAHGTWIRRDRPRLGPATAARFEAASRVTSEQVAAGNEVRARIRAAVVDATADGAVLVAPAAAGPAPVRGAHGSEVERVRAATLRLTAVAGLAGAPVVVVPGASVGGFPLGVALIGAPGSDLALLDVAVAAAGGGPSPT